MIFLTIDQIALSFWKMGGDEDVGAEGGEEGVELGRGGGREIRKRAWWPSVSKLPGKWGLGEGFGHTSSLAGGRGCEGASLGMGRQEAEKAGTACVDCLWANWSHIRRLFETVIEMAIFSSRQQPTLKPLESIE